MSRSMSLSSTRRMPTPVSSAIRSLLCGRQGEPEHRAFTAAARRTDRSPVPLDDAAADREADAGSRRAGMQTDERLEETLRLLLVEAEAIVDDADHHHGRSAAG